MRITSGLLRNRRFNVPKQDVRPTKEAVREAVFSSLGGTCEGMRVLDLFAGAGSLGLEAWSRGAEAVTFVELNGAVWKNLQDNIAALESDELGRTSCIKADAIRWLARADERFDLIFADPPYDLPEAMTQTLEGIAKHSVLAADGLLVYELRSSDPVVADFGWRVVREKKYGAARIVMLQLSKEEAS